MENEGALYWLHAVEEFLDEVEADRREDTDMDFLQRRFLSAMANTRDLIMMISTSYGIANGGGIG